MHILSLSSAIIFLLVTLYLQVTVSLSANSNQEGKEEEIDLKYRRLSRLLRTNNHVVDTTEKYLAQEEERLSGIRNALKDFKHRGMENDKKKIQNPINAFKLIKLMSVDLKKLLRHTNISAYTTDLREMLLNGTTEQSINYPGDRDWQNVVIALTNFHSRTLLMAPSLVDQVKHPDDEESMKIVSASQLLNEGYMHLFNRNHKEAEKILNDALLQTYHEENTRKEISGWIEKEEECKTSSNTPLKSQADEISLRMEILQGLSISAYQKELMSGF